MKLCAYSDQLILAEIASVKFASDCVLRVKRLPQTIRRLLVSEKSAAVILVFVSVLVFVSYS